MKTNMGLIDRAIRIAIAVLIGVLYFTNVITGVTAIVLLILATAFIVTGFVGFCPLYSLLKITTRRNKSANV